LRDVIGNIIINSNETANVNDKKIRDLVHFEHVQAHRGEKYNELADQLANEGRSK
jgi:ribonuclease HI